MGVVMNKRYAIVEDGVVTNIVLWDGIAEWKHPGQAIDASAKENEFIGVGWTYDGEAFKAPKHPPPPPEEPE